MAINPSQFTATPVDRDINVAIKLLANRPNPNELLDTPVRGSELVGFYDAFQDVVELYVTDINGTRYLRIG